MRGLVTAISYTGWAASEKVWIVEETFDCVGKRAGSHTPAVPTGLRYCN
jgi:hypothetical protein